MNIIKPNIFKYNLVRQNYNIQFRNNEQRIGKKCNNIVFLGGYLYNPLIEYEFITIPIEAGNYKFKIVSQDKLNNYNDGNEIITILTEKLYHPINFNIKEINGNDVTLQWNIPTIGLTADYYKIYGNNGSGYVIDRSTVLATSANTDTEVILTSLVDGVWFFVIEAVHGTFETENYWTVKVTLPETNEIPVNPNIPNNQYNYEMLSQYQPQNVFLSNYSVGKCKIEFLWLYGSKASNFRIYHDDGTGTIDWSTYKFRYARQNSIIQIFITDQILTEDGQHEYKFGIRAESPTGIVDDNTVEYTVLLDGKEPDNVINITGEER